MNKTAKINYIVVFVATLSVVFLIASIIVFAVNHVSKAQIKEVTAAAEELTVRNFNTAYYYGIASLAAEEGYDPAAYPEGYAPCSSEIFPDANSLVKYITDTYVTEEAARIVSLTTADGRPRYTSVDNKLCMAVVSGDTAYDKDFTKASFYIENITKKSADLYVMVPSKTEDQQYRLNLSMVKQGENWLLTNLVY